tara:strand:- start:2124 stop:2654 length:531 start_codon:yes stop_codon:yes gene_type:complete
MLTIGLDVSTTKIGIFVLDDKGEQKFWDYLNLTSSNIEKDLLSRAVVVEEWFSSLSFESEEELDWHIEAPLFITGGMSNANTIAKLIAFNWLVRWLLHKQFTQQAKQVNVNSARKLVFGSMPKGVDRKLFVKEEVTKLFPEILEIPKKYQDDITDAYVIARAGYELRKAENSQSES